MRLEAEPFSTGQDPSAGHRRCGAVKAAMTALWVSVAAPLAAQEPPELAIRFGKDGGSYEGAGLAYRFGPWWSKDLGRWRASLRPEVEFTHFRYTGSTSADTALNEIGGIGLFRIHYGTGALRPYGEFGLGLSLFGDGRLGHKEFSTRYQFSEHVGLGVEFSGRWFAGWRYSHYSNANIEKPNPGLDLHQIVIGIRF